MGRTYKLHTDSGSGQDSYLFPHQCYNKTVLNETPLFKDLLYVMRVLAGNRRHTLKRQQKGVKLSAQGQGNQGEVVKPPGLVVMRNSCHSFTLRHKGAEKRNLSIQKTSQSPDGSQEGEKHSKPLTLLFSPLWSHLASASHWPKPMIRQRMEKPGRCCLGRLDLFSLHTLYIQFTARFFSPVLNFLTFYSIK